VLEGKAPLGDPLAEREPVLIVGLGHVGIAFTGDVLLQEREGGVSWHAVILPGPRGNEQRLTTAGFSPCGARSRARRDTRVETRIRAEALRQRQEWLRLSGFAAGNAVPAGAESGRGSHAGPGISRLPAARTGTGPVVHQTRGEWPRGIIRTSPLTPRRSHEH
jgi:hypothetical protein